MCRVFFLGLVVVSALLLAAQAQLTFSTDWGNGKRSVRADDCGGEEGIYAVYKLIQREAEKFLACQTEGKN